MRTGACHIVLTAEAGLAPFESSASIDAAVAAIAGVAARSGGVVLAFAVLPNEVDVLLGGADAGDLSDLARSLGTNITRRVNRVLRRKGGLFAGQPVVSVLDPDADWLELAEAIEQRVVAAELAADPTEAPSCSAYPEYGEWVRQAGAGPTRRPARRRAKPELATIGQVIRVADVPTVVQLPVVRRLAADLAAAGEKPPAQVLEPLREYVVRWFLGDRRTLAVARTILGSLTRTDHGAGFFVTGLYGAGKSHLLAVLSVIAESAALRDELLASHPELSDLAASLRAAGERLVVPLALDEQPPSADLEEVVFAAAAAALRRRTGVDVPLAETDYVLDLARQHLLAGYGADLDELAGGSWRAMAEGEPDRAAAVVNRLIRQRVLPFRFGQSRVERLGRLLELTAAAGLAGVVFLFDELSVFLSGRDHRGLHADAGFLQFLGQRAEISPLWVVAALQRQIEDVGDVEHYTLRQIKDRYETRLSLPLTATRQVLAHKILPRRDPASLEAAVEASLRAWTGGGRRIDLTAGKLRDVYPLHPLTFACLEACAERFLAKTRSIVEFAAARVGGDELCPGVLDRPVTALITPDELWDHFVRDIAHHADLRRYREVVADYYEHHLESLLGEENPLAWRLVKLLLVLRLGGLERGVKDLAAGLEPASEGLEERVAGLLETFRTAGAYVVVERRPGRYNDVYRIDLDFDVNETIRRRARSLEATLKVGDGRLTAVAVEACQEESFPLSSALHAHALEVLWRNTARGVFVALRDLVTVSPHELVNQAALLSGSEVAEAAYLYLAEPQRVARQREAFMAALTALDDDRWTNALAAWLPREATEDERAAWVADVALELLRGDPTLAAGERGEAIRARLDEQADERCARLAELLRRLYAEGALITRGGENRAPAGDWREALREVASRLFERVLPRFADVAPRREGLKLGDADDLIERFMVEGEVTVLPRSVLACAIEDLAAPLGIVAGERGEYRIRVDRRGPAEELLESLPPQPVSLGAVEAYLARSEWGLVPAQTSLLVAALVRRGHLAALDDDGAPAALGTPLRAHIAAVLPAALVQPELWESLEAVSQGIFGRPLPPLEAATQQDLFERLVRWREAALAGGGEIREATTACAQALGHEEVQWRETAGVVERVEALAAAVEPGLLAADGLARFAAFCQGFSADELAATLRSLQVLRQFAQSGAEPLLAAYRDLASVPLPTDDPLAARREELLTRFAMGETVAFEAAGLLDEVTTWRHDYADAYIAWHARVHDSARFEPYDRFRTSPRMRVLLNLSRLELDVAQNAEVVTAELRRERAKQCRRADLALTLRDHAVCPECRIALGETVALRPLATLERAADEGIDAMLRVLRLPEHREMVERGIHDLELDDPRVGHVRLLLRAEKPTPEQLLAATSFAVIDLLNLVLTTRIIGRRSVQRLTERLANKRLTARQIRRAFDQWLDPTGDVGEDDLLELEE